MQAGFCWLAMMRPATVRSLTRTFLEHEGYEVFSSVRMRSVAVEDIRAQCLGSRLLITDRLYAAALRPTSSPWS